MTPLILTVAVAAAHPSALHTYRDWIVGCDNVRACQANALASVACQENWLELTINRGAMPGDSATLFVPLPDGRIGARLSIKVDGANAITFTALSKDSAALPLTGALLAAMRNGGRLTLHDAGGRTLGEASLSGLAAALRYVDDQQGRVGTVGALQATGAKPDSETPVPPAYPVILTPAPTSKPPRSVSVAVATRLIGEDSATCDEANGGVKPRAYRLDAAHSLVLIDLPCGNGAYNAFTAVYVLDETGKVRPARFDLAPGMGDADELTNGDWDPKTRRLSSFEKGRGIGDCGTTEDYAWDGARFRLVEQDQMTECRGSTDYIRTWIARERR